jgi:hypothetical protein
MPDVDVMAIKLNTTLANKMVLEGTENDGYNKELNLICGDDETNEVATSPIIVNTALKVRTKDIVEEHNIRYEYNFNYE